MQLIPINVTPRDRAANWPINLSIVLFTKHRGLLRSLKKKKKRKRKIQKTSEFIRNRRFNGNEFKARLSRTTMRTFNYYRVIIAQNRVAQLIVYAFRV